MEKEFDLISLLKKAQSLELSRFKTYIKNSEKVLNPEGKRVLLFLADSEKEHLELLRKEIINLKELNDIDLNDLFDININAKPKKEERRFDDSIRSIIGDINVIKAAILLEKLDGSFYQKLSQRTGNRNGKKLFLFLKAREVSHLKLLKRKLLELQKISARLSAIQDTRILFSKMK